MTAKEPLSVTHPELAKQAYGWDPTTVSKGLRVSKKWICEFGHVWSASVDSRVSGQGCPVCSGRKVRAGFNDLATLEPQLASQAFGWDPTTVTRSSNGKKEWICEFGHVWSAVIASRSSGRGCPICTGRKVLPGFNDLAILEPELASQAFGWDPATFTRGSSASKKWKCEFGHVTSSPIVRRVSGIGCAVCSNQKILVGFNDLATTDPDLAKQAHGWDPKTVTKGSNRSREWICKYGHVWNATIKGRTRGYGCLVCNGKQVLVGFNDLATTDPNLANQAHGWDPKTVTRGSGAVREWMCEFGHVWPAVISSRTSGNGCAVCDAKRVLVGFNDLATSDPDLAKQAYEWDPTTVTRGSNVARKWVCEFGHVWMATPGTRSSGRGCASCSVTGYDPSLEGWLYFLSHPDWEMFQIGITNVPTDRLRTHQNLGWEVLELRGPMDGLLARRWEKSILQMLKRRGAKLGSPEVAGKFNGYTEAWLQNTLQVNSLHELMEMVHEDE